MSEVRIASDGAELRATIASPTRAAPRQPGLVLCHGFPSGPADSTIVGRDMPQLANRVAVEMGWTAVAFLFRGCGESTGQFSLGGWAADVQAVVEWVLTSGDVDSVWIAGFGTGGALGLCAAARDERVSGAAALGAPADFADWAGHPKRLIEHARTAGVIDDPDYPPSVDRWARQLRELRAEECAAGLSGRPVLLVHGSDDELVPLLDARAMADAHGGADLRVIAGAGHDLRHDPRSIAVLLGWLDRHQTASGLPAGNAGLPDRT